MKKIFSIILPLLFLSGGIAFAFNTQDEPACTERGHTGYTYDGPNDAPQLPFDPTEAGLTNVGQFGDQFDCSNPTPEECHWVYIPASGSNPARWVACEAGGYKDLTNPSN